MKKLLFISLIFVIPGFDLIFAQPVSLRSDITLDSLTTAKSFAVRIEPDPITNSLYYFTFFGEIYKIIQGPGIAIHDSLVATETQHGINYMQGFVFKDSMMFVCGNHKENNSSGYGIIACGVLQPNGSRIWHNVVTTEPYPSSATLYDHAFSCILFNPAGDSILFASGSRTDHGEVQTHNGEFPNTRDVPLTSKIFIIPANSNALFLPNNDLALDSMGVVYARGVRNTFDMCFDAQGHLFGSENSGDRDDPDELNWIRKGNHYGFPWEMGGNQTPMQFPGYVPASDKHINHHCLGWTSAFFYNDSAYIQKPPGLTITQPIRNYGPDADKYRTPLTGQVEDASDLGTYITSFTSHRSPLGLVFDKLNNTGGGYTGDGFVLSYTKGTLDNSGSIPDPPDSTIGPFADLSEDLLQLEMTFDSTITNFSMTAKKIVTGLHSPVDAYFSGKKLYVLESGLASPSVIRIINFPGNNAAFIVTDTTICKKSSVVFTDMTPGPKISRTWNFAGGTATSSSDSMTTVSYDSTGKFDVTLTILSSNGFDVTTKKMLITVAKYPGAAITAGGPVTFCSGSNVTLTANTGNALTYQWKKGNNFISGTSYSRNVTATGNYRCIVTNSAGCSSYSNIIGVMVNPKPTASVSANGPIAFCPGGQVTLQAETGPGYIYNWKKNSNFISGADDSDYIANTSGTYLCKITNGFGCSVSSNSIDVMVNTPKATLTTTDSTTFCKGQQALLHANSGAGLIYQWIRNNTNINGATDSVYSAKWEGTYKVRVTNACGVSTSGPELITAYDLPAASITASGPVTFCTDTSVTLNANTGIGFSYKWKKYSSFITGATNSSFIAFNTGSYKVNITDTNGCSANSNAIAVTVNCKEDESIIDTKVSMTPNPFTNDLRISFEHFSSHYLTIAIYNTAGQLLIRNEKIVPDEIFVTGHQLVAGVYFVRIIADDLVWNFKVVKE